MRTRSILVRGAATAAFAAVLAVASEASADYPPRFVATLHGGTWSESGGGIALELRLFGNIYLGGGFDFIFDSEGTYGNYAYNAPTGFLGYAIAPLDVFEIKLLAGVRAPLGLAEDEGESYHIVGYDPIAFTGGVRVSFLISYFVVGAQMDFTPHSVSWVPGPGIAGHPESTFELPLRLAAVLGGSFGFAEPEKPQQPARRAPPGADPSSSARWAALFRQPSRW